MRRFLCYALLAAPLFSRAGGVLDSSVSYDAGVYTLSIEARIDAPAAMVYRLITDYDHLQDINPAVRESRILRTDGPEKCRIHVVTRVCVLFYCRDITQSQDMVQSPGYRIEATILPEYSDFRSGRAQWRLTPEGDATVMHFRAELEPDFFMPPLIGPWLIRREMASQIKEIVMIIEARHHRNPVS